jgi:hypothetical protein
MKNLDVEVEGGELLLQSDNGSYAIIPKRERNRVMYYLKSGKQDKLNKLISKLPTEKDYAKNGTLLPPFKNKQVNSFENNTLTAFNMSGKEDVVNKTPIELQQVTVKGKKDSLLPPFTAKEGNKFEKNVRKDFNMGGTEYPVNKDKPIELPEATVSAKRAYDYEGCVTGMCHKMASDNKMGYEEFRKMNNLYGNAWNINKNSYGQDVDVSDYNNLKVGDIVNLTRDVFKSDKEKGIPSENQHVGYVSKIVDGKPYVTHYIGNIGVKSDGKGTYGEYFEEPIDNISERFKYRVTGAKRIEQFKEVDTKPTEFKFNEGYEPNKIETDFLKMHDDKANIQNKLKLTNDEYEELSRVAYGIMGNESAFGRSGKTLYRMAIPDFAQKMVRAAVDLKRGTNTYDDNINNLSQGYSSTKESTLHNVSANDGSTNYKEINARIKEGDYEGLERTNNYLYHAFNQLGLNPDNLEDGTNSAKAIMATLAWYKKRNPNATTEDLLKMYTGKNDIRLYKKSFDKYLGNISGDSEKNLEYDWKQNLYGKLSEIANDTNADLKSVNSKIVSTIRDYSPLPTQYNALISDVLQGKEKITEKTLSKSNLDTLKEIVKANVSKGKFNLEYNDYGTSKNKNSDVGGAGSEGPMSMLTKSFTNDAYILKTLLGQAGIRKIDDKTYEVIDTFDFNDAGTSFGIFDDLKKRGISPYAIARSVGRNYGSPDGQGQVVRIRITLD